MRQSQHQQDAWHEQDPARKDRCNQQRQWRNRGDFVPAQNVRFALLNSTHASAKQPAAQTPNVVNQREDVCHPCATFGVRELRKGKKENQRE